MAMSKKHYIAVARVISDLVAAERPNGQLVSPNGGRTWDRTSAGLETLTQVADGLSDVFRADNGQFDSGRFITACGL